MSYVYTYKFTDRNGDQQEVGISVNTLDDLLDTNNQFYRRHNKFGNWYLFFKSTLDQIKTAMVNKHPHRRLADEMAKQIAITFFEVMIEDLINNKITYQLPYRFFAKLGIREVTWKKTDDPTRIYVAEPCVLFTEGGRKRVKRIRYYCKLTERWRNRLGQLVEDGQRFPKFKMYA